MVIQWWFTSICPRQGSYSTCLFSEGNLESEDKEEMHSTGEDDLFGPKFYYDKAKSFFDNISSGKKFR